MKRILIGALAALLSLSTLAATLNPVSLINPAGSTSGQAITSNGPTTPPTWATVSAAGLSGTVPITKGGTGAATASAALTALGAMPVAGGTFTGNVGFTTLSATGLITPAPAIGIKGTTTGVAVQAGSIGEPLKNSATGVAISSTVPTTVVSLNLTAGDWDVWGSAYSVNSTATMSAFYVSVSTTTNTLGTNDTTSAINTSAANTNIFSMATPTIIKNVSASTTVYLVVQMTSSTGTNATSGWIYARRR